MSDGIQLQNIRGTTTDLPPPAYVNPAYGDDIGDVASRAPSQPVSPATLESGRFGYANQGFADEKPAKDGVFTISPGHGGRKASSPSSDSDEPHDVEEFEDLDWEEEGEQTLFVRYVASIQTGLHDAYEANKKIIWRIIYVILLLAYAAYFAYAMYYHFGDEPSIRLLWITCFVVLIVALVVFFKYFGEPLGNSFQSATKGVISKHEETISWVAVGNIFLAIIIFIIVDVAYLTKEPYNLVSGAGIIFYVLLFYIFSYNPARVKWRPVAWGLAIQFIFALLILRWDRGYEAFNWLGDRVTEFLLHSDAGAKFVFGDPGLYAHFFAFKVLPIILFFSAFVSMLYYVGVMQKLVRVIAIVMQKLMGTTAGESLNAAGNIFIGQSEAPLLIRPLIGKMTRSELHAVMTGGFATIAGTVLGAYIAFGAPANHLLSASVMSAPAALAMSKLFYPETQKSKTTAKDVDSMEESSERNIIEAASHGASLAISLIANIAANLIAFIALLHFLDATLTWFGERVGIFDPPLTFELICSYVLYPFAIVMGVRPGRDARNVARLIGVKTFLNEFVAYDYLGTLFKNEEKFLHHTENLNGTWEYSGDLHILLHPVVPHTNVSETLSYGFMSERSSVIATYALCGFSNLGSMGIQLGALGAMAPHRTSDLSAIVLRAMIAGNVACFMTACIAGLFFQPEL